MERRGLLAALGGTALTLLAGCTDSGESGVAVEAPDADANDGPEQVIETWNQIIYEDGSITDDGPALLHDESPLGDELEFFAQQERADRQLESSEISVEERDLSVSAIEDQLFESMDTAVLERIAAQNAIVVAELSFSGPEAPASPTTDRWLTAVDGDEWRVFSLVE